MSNASADHVFGADALNPSETGCPSARGGGPQLGVCEALLRSSNLWFAGLELTLDGSAVLDPTAASARP